MNKKMGLLKRLRLATKLAGNMSEEERGTIAKIMPGHTKTAAYRGISGMLNAYSRSPWVRAVESKISDAVGSTSWQLYGLQNRSGKFVRNAGIQAKGLSNREMKLGEIDNFDGELVPIPDHPMLRLLNYSNPLFPGSVGRSQTQISLDLTGEAFWLLGPENMTSGGAFIPERFWLLPSTWITSMPSPDEPWWEVQTPSWRGKFPEQAILRFVTPNPVNPYGRGSGIFRAFGDEIDTDEYAAQHVKSWFLNKARPDLLITGEGMSESDTTRMETTWIQNLRGFMRAHKPFFIARKVDVHQISQKFSDMELGALRAWERDIIVHGIGMPPEILGIIENSNRSTIDAADYLWSRWVITPRLELQRSFLQWQLAPMYDDRLILAYKSPVAEDKEYQLSVMKANPAVFKVSDWKKQAGVEYDEADDVYVLPFNVKVVANLTPTVDPTTLASLAAREVPFPVLPAKDGPAQLPCGCEVMEAVRDADSVPSKLDQVNAMVRRTKAIGGQGPVNQALLLTEQMERDVIQAFVQLRNDLDLAKLAQLFDAGDIEGAMALISEADVAASMESAVQTLKEAVVAAGEASATALGNALGESVAFALTNPEAVSFLEAYGAQMVVDITPGTREAIRAALHQAYELGLTPQEAAKSIKEMIGLTDEMMAQRKRLVDAMIEGGASQAEVDRFVADWTEKKIKYRAKVIAENELVTAGNQGQEMLWDQAVGEGYLDPATTKRVWITTSGDRVCKICNPMDGVETGLNEPWQTSIGAVNSPNEAHVHCHCVEALNVVR